MSDRRIPLFLGRVSYRQRRLADAARLLPIFGAVLMGVPLLWPNGGAEGTPTTSGAMIYIFGCWAVLALAAAALAAVLNPDSGKGQGEGMSADPQVDVARSDPATPTETPTETPPGPATDRASPGPLGGL